MSKLDFDKINALAEGYKPQMTAFLRDMVEFQVKAVTKKKLLPESPKK